MSRIGSIVTDLADSAAIWADRLRLGVFLRISGPGKYVQRKKIATLPAFRAVDGVHPEEIEHIDLCTVRKQSTVELTYPVRNIVFDGAKLPQNFFSVNQKRILDWEICDWIDIVANSPHTQLRCLSDGRSAPHEWIKDDGIRDAQQFIEKIAAFRREDADDHCTEHRAEPVGPPLVDIIQRAVDFLAPALDFCNLAKGFEGEIFIFDRSRTTRNRKRDTRQAGASERKLRLIDIDHLHARDARCLVRYMHCSLIFRSIPHVCTRRHGG